MSIEFKLHDVTDITVEASTDFIQALHAHRFSFTEAGDDIIGNAGFILQISFVHLLVDQ
jgi:hypothetical protein